MNEITKIAIEEIEKHGYKYKEIQNEIFITTPKSSWWLDCSNIDNIKLWHKNMRWTANNKKFGNDYHLQKDHIEDIAQAIIYIKKHDNAKYSLNENSRSYNYYKKMEKLFEKIKT